MLDAKINVKKKLTLLFGCCSRQCRIVTIGE